MKHDKESEHYEWEFCNGIMGENGGEWSPCNNMDFMTWYQAIGKHCQTIKVFNQSNFSSKCLIEFIRISD